MDPESIVAICFSVTALLGSILTFSYVNNKTSFGDKQNTNITNISETYYPQGGLASVKKLTFNTDDNDRYGTQSLQFKNGKQEVKASGSKKPINIDAVDDGKDPIVLPTEKSYLGTSPVTSPRIAIKRYTDGKDSVSPHEVIEISDLGLMFDNDLQGEKVASDMRKTNYYYATEAFVKGINNDYNLIINYFDRFNSPKIDLMGSDDV